MSHFDATQQSRQTVHFLGIAQVHSCVPHKLPSGRAVVVLHFAHHHAVVADTWERVTDEDGITPSPTHELTATLVRYCRALVLPMAQRLPLPTEV